MDALCELTSSFSAGAFRLKHRGRVEQELGRGVSVHQVPWTEATAVGPDDFGSAFRG